MKLHILLIIVFLITFLSRIAQGQECSSGSTCMPKADVDAFVELLREKKCMQTTQPKFEFDEIKLLVDKDGRVFYNGAMPHPYKLKMNWCGLEVNAEGHLKVYAAVNEPSNWGFRFRPKAYISFLLAEPFYAVLPGEETPGFEDVWDAGVMVDFFHYDFVNVNVAVGWRSLGGGVGFDITKNFGAYVGYGLTWGAWHHNPNVGIYFGF